jgi:prevent-host-death family protein
MGFPLAKSVPLAELKAKCSAVVAQVRRTRVSRLVTVRGAPAVEICPLPAADNHRPIFGGLVGTVVIRGDIVSADDDVVYRDDLSLFGRE